MPDRREAVAGDSYPHHTLRLDKQCLPSLMWFHDLPHLNEGNLLTEKNVMLSMFLQACPKLSTCIEALYKVFRLSWPCAFYCSVHGEYWLKGAARKTLAQPVAGRRFSRGRN
jgi:hypothetical protein